MWSYEFSVVCQSVCQSVRTDSDVISIHDIESIDIHDEDLIMDDNVDIMDVMDAECCIATLDETLYEDEAS